MCLAPQWREAVNKSFSDFVKKGSGNGAFFFMQHSDLNCQNGSTMNLRIPIPKTFKLILSFFIMISTAESVPRYALKNGETCSLCHVNPSGSGLRTEYGNSLVSGEELPVYTEEVSYSGMISEHLQLGGDVRLQRIVAEPDTTGIQTAGFPMQADIYGAVKPTKQIDIIWKIDLLNSYHQVWSQIKIFPNGGMIRFGKTMPTYGLRLADHTAFIKGGNLSLDYDLPQEGLPFSPRKAAPFAFETAVYLGDLYITAGVSETYLASANWGLTFTRNLREQTLFSRVEYSGSLKNLHFTAGGSVMHEDNLNLRGFFGGMSFWKMQWLAEVDWARNWAGENVSMASYNHLNYSLMQGLDVGFKFETFDVDIDSSGQSIQRLSLGIDYIPIPYVQIKAQVRKSETMNPDFKGKPEYLLQLHTWF